MAEGIFEVFDLEEQMSGTLGCGGKKKGGDGGGEWNMRLLLAFVR